MSEQRYAGLRSGRRQRRRHFFGHRTTSLLPAPRWCERRRHQDVTLGHRAAAIKRIDLHQSEGKRRGELPRHSCECAFVSSSTVAIRPSLLSWRWGQIMTRYVRRPVGSKPTADDLLVLNNDDVANLVRAAIKREGSQLAFAKRHRIDRTDISAFLNGRRGISPSLAKAFGIRIVWVVDKPKLRSRKVSRNSSMLPPTEPRVPARRYQRRGHARRPTVEVR